MGTDSEKQLQPLGIGQSVALRERDKAESDSSFSSRFRAAASSKSPADVIHSADDTYRVIFV